MPREGDAGMIRRPKAFSPMELLSAFFSSFFLPNRKKKMLKKHGANDV
jgi:hypothetical protein